MKVLEASAEIDAPIERCHKLAKDLALLHSYLQLSSPQHGVEITPAPSSLQIGDTPMSRGVEYLFTTRTGPLKSGFKVRLDRERPPNEVALSGTQPMQSSYRLYYHFSESGASTEMKLKMEMEFSDSLTARLFSPLAVALQRASLQTWTTVFRRAAEDGELATEILPQGLRKHGGRVPKNRWPRRDEPNTSEQFQAPKAGGDQFEGISGKAVALFFVGLLMLAVGYLYLFGIH